MPSSPALPPLSPIDRPLLARLFALNEDYTALAAELAAAAPAPAATPPSLLSPLCSSPLDLLDLFAWSTGPAIAPWIAHFRQIADLQHRTLALTTLESVIKTTESSTERRRAATTLLRALDRAWPTLHAPGQSKIRNPKSKIFPAPPPPISRPIPSADPDAELTLLRAAFSSPQASVALSTLHEHAAPNASFAAHPVHPDKAEWIASAPGAFPAGFRFPLALAECKELERTGSHSRWTTWARTASEDYFRCSFSLIRDGPDTPGPCWRLATFDIISRSD